MAIEAKKLLRKTAVGTAIVLFDIVTDLGFAFMSNASYRSMRKEWAASTREQRRRLSELFWRWEKHKLIERRGRGEELEIRLTDLGRRHIRRLLADNQPLPRDVPWDGKWHVVVFDVPEEHRAGRNLLRRKLHNLGCYPLQKSVFIYPYEFRAIAEKIREAYDLRSDIFYLIVDEIDRGEELKKLFQRREILPSDSVASEQ